MKSISTLVFSLSIVTFGLAAQDVQQFHDYLRMGDTAGAIQFVRSLKDVDAVKQDSFNPLRILMSYETVKKSAPGVPAFREVFDAILDKGIDVNSVDGKGYTALHNAAGLGLPYYVKRLIEKGANAHLMSSEGFTPFLSATFAMGTGGQHVQEVLDLLLEKGANVNTQLGMPETTGHPEGQPARIEISEEELGTTALHFALTLRDKRMIKYLMDKGADPAIKDKKGVSAADIARQMGDKEIIKTISK